MVPPAMTARLNATVAHATHENNRCLPDVGSIMAQGYLLGWTTLHRHGRDIAPRDAGYDSPMKRLLFLVAAAAIAAVIYKVLTAEIPLEDS